MQNCTELYLQNAPGTSCFMGFMPPGTLQICTKHSLTQNLLPSKGFFHAMGKTREAKFTGYFTILPTHILRETKFIDIFHNVIFSPEYDPTPWFVDFFMVLGFCWHEVNPKHRWTRSFHICVKHICMMMRENFSRIDKLNLELKFLIFPPNGF